MWSEQYRLEEKHRGLLPEGLCTEGMPDSAPCWASLDIQDPVGHIPVPFAPGMRAVGFGH